MNQDDEIIIASVVLTEAHRPTGNTIHRGGVGGVLPPPASLRIMKYESDPGYYLLYLDADGVEQTDTYHDSLEKAQEQAKWEFSIESDEWEFYE